MIKQNATLRLFIAIELPEMIRKPLSDSLKDSVIIKKKKARLTSKENLHITLKFLGDVQQDKRGDLQTAIANSIGGIGPFELKIHSGGVFPTIKKPRILWAGFDISKELSVLVNNLENEFEKIGYSKDLKPFQPHITLARIPDYVSTMIPVEKDEIIKNLEKIDLPPFTVDKISLMKSILLPGKPEYQVISTQNLKVC
ncbi:MAG TPA: RNA 2',3'-cyclic phosphodiesterase [Flexilinea sp.]|nr:RNA 2',3'-cyclic phosphodiesterase [Flexilinea sp.]